MRDTIVGASTSCSVRLAQNRTRRTGWRRDLRHCDDLLGHRAVQGPERICQQRRRAAPQRAAAPEPGAAAALPDWQAAPRPGSSSYKLKSTGRGRGFCRRGASCFSSCPSSPPCPSSVLLRRGACTRTGPSRRSAARVGATSAGVVLCDGGPSPHRSRRVHRTWRPLSKQQKLGHTLVLRLLEPSCLVVVVVVVVRTLC